MQWSIHHKTLWDDAILYAIACRTGDIGESWRFSMVMVFADRTIRDRSWKSKRALGK
jgi:hypothetical protein